MIDHGDGPVQKRAWLGITWMRIISCPICMPTEAQPMTSEHWRSLEPYINTSIVFVKYVV